MIQAHLGGSVETGFEPVQEAFASNFAQHGEVGAACCVYLNGKRVVDLWGGTTTTEGSDPYTADALQMVWSTTKGVVAIAAHMLAQEGKLDFDAPVAEYWPEFAKQGKAKIPVRWLFSHQSGLAAIDRPLTLDDVLAWTPVVEALEAQQPLWEPGTAHGYHTFTYGWLAGEVIRRVAGQSVGAFVAERIAKPLQAEFWIGLPEAQNKRVAPIIPTPPPAPGTPPDALAARIADPTSLAHRSFVNPAIPPTAFNELPFRMAEIPAGNGIGTARGLARIYAATIGQLDGVRLLNQDTLTKATSCHGLRDPVRHRLPAPLPVPPHGRPRILRPLRHGRRRRFRSPEARILLRLRHEPDASVCAGRPPPQRPRPGPAQLH